MINNKQATGPVKPGDQVEMAIMSRSEMDWAIDLADKEGWNPGLHDADAFHAQDPHGFLIGRVNGLPIGCISAIRYEKQFGFIGFYIVLPEFRGMGLGIQLWNAAMQHLEGYTVGLDGIDAQQDNYAKSGFYYAYANTRYAMDVPQTLPPCTRKCIDLNEISFSDLCSYDERHFGYPRPKFLRAWLAQPDSFSLGMQNDQGELAACGCIRKCRSGFKIGPLFADTPKMAESLFNILLTVPKPGKIIYLDCPAVNSSAVAMAEKYGMQPVFSTARMYVGTAPALPTDQIYGVTTFELG